VRLPIPPLGQVNFYVEKPSPQAYKKTNIRTPVNIFHNEPLV